MIRIAGSAPVGTSKPKPVSQRRAVIRNSSSAAHIQGRIQIKNSKKAILGQRIVDRLVHIFGLGIHGPHAQRS